MNEQYTAHVDRVLAHLQPRRLLCLGEPCRSLLDNYVESRTGCELTLLPDDVAGETLNHLGQFDLIVVTATLEYRTKTAAEHLLARLRDRHGARLLVVVPLDQRPTYASRWEAHELLAFGMTSLGVVQQTDGNYQIYLYDLFDYKTVPDWLNARFWAHPERWDKDI